MVLSLNSYVYLYESCTLMFNHLWQLNDWAAATAVCQMI